MTSAPPGKSDIVAFIVAAEEVANLIRKEIAASAYVLISLFAVALVYLAALIYAAIYLKRRA